ncbi:MAG: hypothetical protein JST47_16130 [Bacteroidetes bacterium]|nr:hypothetical protein [Bacteroidota bacterium]
MKKVFAILSLLGGILLLRLQAHSQDTAAFKKADTAAIHLQDSLRAFEAEFDSLFPSKKSHLVFEAGYLSNNVYFGRKDSVATPYITGQLGYYHKSGLYANGQASYLTKTGNYRFDLFAIEAGYLHTFGNLEMQLAANKYFYSNNSYNVKSEIEGTAVAAFAYDWDIISPVLTGTAIFGHINDYAASFGLDHSFYALDDKLEITLSAMANASTENYYNSYYKRRRYAIKRLLKIQGVSSPDSIRYTILAHVLNASTFKLLDYEISLPVAYQYKKFTFSATPVFAIPVNPARVHFVVKTSDGARVINRIYTEKLGNSFFFQANIAYRF